MGSSYFSEVFANLEPVPGQRLESGFSPDLHAESTADSADVSSDQPPLWTREKKTVLWPQAVQVLRICSQSPSNTTKITFQLQPQTFPTWHLPLVPESITAGLLH